jgi:type II secretory ATPase GspE/PulE/Tfp pilus assembly ATPase PilB-like protein
VRKRIGEILIGQAAITEEQLRSALAAQQTRSQLVGQILIAQGATDERTLHRALALQARLPFVDLEGKTPPSHLTERLNAGSAWELEAIPVAEKNGTMIVAVSDPEKAVVADTLGFLLDSPVSLAITSPGALRAALEKAYGSPPDAQAEQKIETGVEDEAPVVRLVNRMFEEAVSMRASDIHIEPFSNQVQIRYRVDGGLQLIAEHPVDLHSALISHIKVNGGLDIAEKRKPQDGRIEHRAGNRDLDVRVSVLPTNHGESVVMRLLDREANLISLEALGMSPKALHWFKDVIDRPNGIFLVTGPTGSGKTTTLYAALQTLNRADRKILTVEDPVEYRIKGINQVQVQPRIGLDFSRVLKAFLRQAPNVVLVGEIRDKETAEVAIQASLTGHLVFSTVHTNDAPSAATRLLDMGVPPFLVATSLQGVLSQRLVRRLCKECKVEEAATPLEKRVLQLKEGAKLFHPRGCTECSRTGYRGRLGAFEWLGMTEDLREALFQSSDGSAFVETAQSGGAWNSLDHDVREKVLDGLTTVQEMLRVTSLSAAEEPNDETVETAKAVSTPSSDSTQDPS